MLTVKLITPKKAKFTACDSIGHNNNENNLNSLGKNKLKKFDKNTGNNNNRFNQSEEKSREQPKGKNAHFINVSCSPRISNFDDVFQKSLTFKLKTIKYNLLYYSFFVDVFISYHLILVPKIIKNPLILFFAMIAYLFYKNEPFCLS